jgi:type I restriction enzyme R subunit
MNMVEQEIENILIQKLTDLKYIYRSDIHDRLALEKNFREKFEELNYVHLTDNEFQRLLEQIIVPDVYVASRILREQQYFERDDGTPLFYTLVNIKDWCKNTFEVVHQLRINTDNSYHRYDVMLLINGVPVVQIELKSLQFSPRRAMEQIINYKNDPGNGYTKTLLCFIQLFIVSSRNDTWYFANNNNRHFSFNAEERYLPIYRFADEKNHKIVYLDEFAETFLAKCELGEMISRYMVLVASEQRLLMMRPYQIYAVKAIVDCIEQNCGNGYIWHTTGSGKTLTSFKASTLLKDNSQIDKCLFVVDRKDLDRQTREEFNRFQEGSVEENTNTESLVRRLLSTNHADKVIVTTIQKLGLALDDSDKRNYKARLEKLRDKRIVFIFDECHRSQFGENHKAIKEFFPNAQLFGFTGTPIFDENASYEHIEGQQGSYKTTESIFQRLLHAYTITNAIEDQNVLRFHIDYFRPNTDRQAKQGERQPKEKVIETILAKHDKATAERKFNAILATSSINDAIEYYRLFKQIQAAKKAENSDFVPLHIACVFSPPANQLQEDLAQERADNKIDPQGKMAALKAIIEDYNKQYKTNHQINEFDLYYHDVQKRIKDQQYPNRDLPYDQKIDIVIVVDMLLTGFDSKYLNTLYVDKNLRYHGLIQAFSRTNRILNDSKPYGTILDFRQQDAAVDEAIALFSNRQDAQAKEIWLVEAAPVVIDKLQDAVTKLNLFMQSEGLQFAPKEVQKLQGDSARSVFINKFKDVQRYITQLNQYTDLTEVEQDTIKQIIPSEQLQGFQGAYIEVAQRLKDKQNKKQQIANDTLQQLDFEFVLFASVLIDYDYIMKLIARYTHEKPNKRDTSREKLIALIEGDAKFIDERDDMIAYIKTLSPDEALDEQTVRAGYETFKAEAYARQLATIANKHGIEASSLQAFVEHILERMIFNEEDLNDLMAPLGLGWKARTRKELALMEDLMPLLHKLAQGQEISGLETYE